MEKIRIADTDITSSRIGLGTWAIGGWMWGGADDQESIKTIHSALDRGINLIDTAPVYGFGHSETVVGEALAQYGKRDQVVLATKGGLQWDENQSISRNSSAQRLQKEIEDSLRRLKTDYIDIYQIHWPDGSTPFADTAATLNRFFQEGKIRAIGVSNFSPGQMDEFRRGGPLHTNQPPFNLFEREIEEDVLPYTAKNHITTLSYGSLCRGLLSGKMTAGRTFEGDDLRKVDPKFKQGRFEQYLDAAGKLDRLAKDQYGKSVLHLALRWVLDSPGSGVALWGARRPDQLDAATEVQDFHIESDVAGAIDQILKDSIRDPVGPQFMAPPESR